jgi:hypothetical protein
MPLIQLVACRCVFTDTNLKFKEKEHNDQMYDDHLSIEGAGTIHVELLLPRQNTYHFTRDLAGL